MLYGRRDSRYRTYRYNNIIIRCFMEGEIVDIELITIIISESSVVLSMLDWHVPYHPLIQTSVNFFTKPTSGGSL